MTKSKSRTVAGVGRGHSDGSVAGYSVLLSRILRGDVEALNTVGTLLTYGVGQRSFAVACHAVSAKRRDPSGLFNFGSALVEGAGVSKNVARGIRLLRAARRAGNHDATNYLAYCTREGIGLKRDAVAAFNLSLEGANAGVPAAEYAVGLCLVRGLGVRQDETAGIRWLTRAAKHGDRFAQELIRNKKLRP